MKKPWSMSTTVRNPERVRGFLATLKELEGQPFDTERQVKYQTLLIKNKLFRPTKLTNQQKQYFKDPDSNMPYSVATDIFEAQNYTDPPMRGRQSVAPLNKMCLCVAKNSEHAIRITSLGNHLVSEDCDLGELFFRYFLKWQLPNAASRSFSASDGFSIKPFLGTLHLINHVNRIWVELGHSPVGISKDEFDIFTSTLIDFREIETQSNKLVEYRKQIRSFKDYEKKEQFSKKFKLTLASEFLGSTSQLTIDKFLKNLRDYGDNNLRYFRLTRYLSVRGNGYYIDLEPRRMIEINKLLETDDASPKTFDDSEEYIEYLSDIDQPELPWQSETDLRRIVVVLQEDIESLNDKLRTLSIAAPSFHFKNYETLGQAELNPYIIDMRSFRQTLLEIQLYSESQSIAKLEEYIKGLRTIYSSKRKKSIELERLATMALIALNDALDVKPNYPVGDDNQPTFTAPANKPDIECFYSTFNSVCEVTMLTDRTQWYSEGPPVMRHVRDFENLYGEKDAYCLFIAPKMHTDTIETFWFAVKHGYKGIRQRIVPLSILQFIELLETLLQLRKKGKLFLHSNLKSLYDEVINLTDEVSDSDKWIETIPSAMEKWRIELLAD